MIRKWLQAYKADQQHKQLQRGFNYAAGLLLEHGKAAVEPLERDVENARDFDDYNSFDRGIENALDKFQKGTYK